MTAVEHLRNSNFAPLLPRRPCWSTEPSEWSTFRIPDERRNYLRGHYPLSPLTKGCSKKLLMPEMLEPKSRRDQLAICIYSACDDYFCVSEWSKFRRREGGAGKNYFRAHLQPWRMCKKLLKMAEDCVSFAWGDVYVLLLYSKFQARWGKVFSGIICIWGLDNVLPIRKDCKF